MISGYQILECLHIGRCTNIYRAIECATARAVVIKVPNSAYPTGELLWQLRHQYTIGKHLHHPQIIETYALGSDGDRYALVMEDFGGISLQQWLEGSPSANIATKLQIAIDLAAALAELSRVQIVHQHINPANILIHPDTFGVKLIDFGIASLLPKETLEISNPNILAGTLPYLAPEQTGRMNRGIDYRCDFYSLGITLYELFAGKLPFIAREPNEWIECHLDRVPPQLNEIVPEVPAAIAKIVAKLMAKAAEDRYQTTAGLKHDLECCRQQYLTTGRIANFELGEWDTSDRFTIAERAYGQEVELKTLLAAFNRVNVGGSEFILVAGASGIGKSKLVNELERSITRSRGFIIKGKFDLLNRDLPRSAFVSAFETLLDRIARDREERLAQWKAKILAAVGTQGQLLIEMLPGLELIIGEQPSVSELTGAAAQERFDRLFQNFIAVFAAPQQPLVICLDDLQWADLASLELIKLLMAGSGSVLLVGTYRDNEVSIDDPLARTIESLIAQRRSLHKIELKPLTFADTNRQIADSLHCSIDRTQALSEIIYRHTQGNPFFTTQLLKSLYADGAIYFTPSPSPQQPGKWDWDLDPIELLCIDNVGEFMAAQLQKLPGSTQSLLELAACIGHYFDREMLAIVAHQSPAVIDTDLQAALRSGLIVAVDRSPQSTANIDGNYRFLHDRVQQAAYALIPELHRQQRHLQIGKSLLANVANTAKPERLFAIVHHFNAALDRLYTATERAQIARLNFDAALKAKAAIAYPAAYNYAQIGVDLLGQSGWQQQSKLTLTLHEILAETAFLCGNFSQVELIFTEVEYRSLAPLDRANIYATKIKCHIIQKQYREALESGLKILKQLGIKIAPQPSQLTLIRELTNTKIALAGKSDEHLLNLPAITDRDCMAPLAILDLLLMPAYFSNPELLVTIVTMGIRLTLQRGNTPWAAAFFTGYALVLGSLGELKQSYRLGKLAIELNVRFPDLAVAAKVISSISLYCQPLREDARQMLLPIDNSIAAAIAGGNLTYMGISSHVALLARFYTGMSLTEIAAKIPELTATIERSQDESSQQLFAIYCQGITNLITLVDRPDLVAATPIQERELIDRWLACQDASSLSTVYCLKTYLAYLFAEPQVAVEYADLQLPYERAESSSFKMTQGWTIDALARLATYNTQPKQIQNQILKRVDFVSKQLLERAYLMPGNFQHKYDLVQAEKCRVLGDFISAIELFDRAIAGAQTHQYLQEEALANEVAAKFYLEWDKAKIAATYMQSAYYCYVKWGATAKTADLERRYPELLAPILQARSQSQVLDLLSQFSTITTAQRATNSPTEQSFDLVAAIQTAQTLGSIIELPVLLRQICQLAIEYADARACIPILRDRTDTQWQVCTVVGSEIQHTPLTADERLPIEFIQQAIERVQSSSTWIGSDPLTNCPCLPLVYRGELQGLLYLEYGDGDRDRLGTEDRQILLEYLASQAAIAIHNAQLYESVVQRSAAMEASLDGFAILDNNRFIYLNRSHAEMFGYATTELIGRSWHCLYSAEQIRKFETIAFPAVAQSGQWRGEVTATRKDGSTFDEEVTLFLVNNNQLICICRDITERKTAQRERLAIAAALRDSEARYHQLIANIPAAVYEYEATADGGKINYLSERFTELFDISAAAVIEDINLLFDRVHPEERKSFKRSFERSARLGKAWLWEGRLLMPSGQIEWIRGESRHLRTEDGRNLWHGILVNVTQRKQAERVLEFTQFAVDNAADGIIWVRADGSVAYGNQAMCQMLGYSSTELTTLSIWDIDRSGLISAADWPIRWQHLKQVRSMSIESEHTCRDGSYYPAEISINYFEFEGEEYNVAQVRDITNRKRAELALRESERRYQKITDNLPGVIYQFQLAADGSVSYPYVNSGSWDLFNLAPEEIMSDPQSAIAMIHPNEREEFYRATAESAQNLTPKLWEGRAVLPSGEIKWVKSASRPERQPDGSTIWDGMMFDITDRKQAEIALQQSQDRYHKLANNIPGVIYQLRLADGKFNFPYISSGCDRLFNIPAAVIIDDADRLLGLMHPEDLAGFEATIARSAGNLSEAVVWEGRALLPEGRVVWTKSTARPELQADGSIVWDGVIIDITAQKAAERERSRQEDALKALVEWSASGKTGNEFYHACIEYLAVNFHVCHAFITQFLDPNLEHAVVRWYSNGEFLDPIEMNLAGTPCLETYQFRWHVVPKGLQSQFHAATALANLDGESYLGTVIVDSEGNILGNLGFVDTKPLPEDIGAMKFIVQLFADRIGAEMTRHDDEEQLRKSQQQMKAFIDNSAAAMYLKDLAGRYILINQTCVNHSGGDADRFIGQTDEAIYPPEIAAMVMANDRQLLSSGEAVSIEERAISPDDGVERIYLSNKFVLTDDNGQPYAIGGVSTEITDRKRAQEAIERTNQQLELANQELHRATRLKDEFLATMSHELRTPLNAILGMSEALEEGVFGDLNPRQLQSIATIASSGDHLLALINDILDVSKLIAGKIELHLDRVEIAALCQSSLSSISPQANAKQIQIETQIDSAIGKIEVDERRIRQVLINLLGNAVKFTPNGGRIQLKVELLPTAAGSSLRLAIRDTGIGISPADLDKLFQPFSQIDSRLNRQYQGSGLGLTIVRQLVELHGGEVTVESEIDRGSCFSFTIPQAGRELPPAPPIDTDTPAAQPALLLVEDNPVNIATFDSYLTAKGYRISLAQTGAEAIESTRSKHFDAILMDIQMPDLDGIAAIEQIRQQPHHARTPIIVLTALTEPDLRTKCLALGADRFLLKPVKLSELNRTIEECLANTN